MILLHRSARRPPDFQGMSDELLKREFEGGDLFVGVYERIERAGELVQRRGREWPQRGQGELHEGEALRRGQAL